MRKLSHDLAHRLAAEYALGTLRGRARARFESIAQADAEVDAIRRQWEAAFAPFAERVPAIEPPARVWKRIEERIAPRAAEGGTWSSFAFWRGFGLMAGGVASVLLAAFLYTSGTPPRADPAFVAVLISPTNEARMTITMQSDALHIHNVRGWKSVQDAGRSLELWALPKEGAPRSLGLVSNTGGDFLIRIPADDARVQGVKAFVLSSEPAGGSPTRQPTGPVLCSGLAGPARKT